MRVSFVRRWLNVRDSGAALDPDKPLVQWLTFTGLTLFGALLLVYFGHLQRMVENDRSFISPVIALLYVVTSCECLVRILAITNQTDRALVIGRGIGERQDLEALKMLVTQGGRSGVVLDHIRDLAAKSEAQSGGAIDQTLLLRALASRMSDRNKLGSFMADLILKLGLIGTIIGFIMMLAPISGLDIENQGAVKSSVASMSDGMAVAMYTTLAGLAAALLLKIQYGILDRATNSLFGYAVRLTEVHVVPLLKTRAGAAP